MTPAQRVLNYLSRTMLSHGGRSYDLAPRPSTPPPSPVSKLDWRHTGRLRRRDNTLLPGEGEGAGKEMNHSAARKPGPL
jgi:hypothetical protein